MADLSLAPPKTTTVAPASSASLAARERIVAAALDCIAARGLSTLTVEEIAARADCSRATVYRAYPGGRDHLIRSVAAHELERYRSELDRALDRTEDLEVLVVTALVTTSRFVAHSRPLQYLLVHEPEAVLPHVAFERLDPVFGAATRLLGPHVGRFVAEAHVAEVCEWVARLALAYTLLPASTDLTDRVQAQTLVRRYVLPGLAPLSKSPGPRTVHPRTYAHPIGDQP